MSLVKRKFLGSDVQSCYRGCAYIPGLWPSLRPGAKTGDISLRGPKTTCTGASKPWGIWIVYLKALSSNIQWSYFSEIVLAFTILTPCYPALAFCGQQWFCTLSFDQLRSAFFYGSRYFKTFQIFLLLFISLFSWTWQYELLQVIWQCPSDPLT